MDFLGVRRLKATVADLVSNVNRIGGRLEPVADRVNHAYWPASDDGRTNHIRLAGKQDIERLEGMVAALATALGYEWVPEGKTKARWEKKAEIDERMRAKFRAEEQAFLDALMSVPGGPPAPPKRRKGDKKGGKK